MGLLVQLHARTPTAILPYWNASPCFRKQSCQITLRLSVSEIDKPVKHAHTVYCWVWALWCSCVSGPTSLVVQLHTRVCAYESSLIIRKFCRGCVVSYKVCHAPTHTHTDPHKQNRNSTSSARGVKSTGEVAWEKEMYLCVLLCVCLSVFSRFICFSPVPSGVKNKQRAWSLVTRKQSYNSWQQYKHQSCLVCLCVDVCNRESACEKKEKRRKKVNEWTSLRALKKRRHTWVQAV